MKLFDDYKNLVVKPQQEFIKRHWKGYTVTLIAYFAGLLAFIYRDVIKGKIKSIFGRKSKGKKS